MKLPIDLPIKTMTSKVSVEAHARRRMIANSHGFLLQDVLSVCLLHMPEDDIVKLLEEQARILDGMPKSVRAVLKYAEGMSYEQRQMMSDALTGEP